MGMTIKSALEYLKDFDSYTPYQEAINKVSDWIELFQVNYKARLKADMVAMLDELDLELYEQYEDTDSVKVKYIRQSIQEKIDKLKGEQGNANSN